MAVVVMFLEFMNHVKCNISDAGPRGVRQNVNPDFCRVSAELQPRECQVGFSQDNSLFLPDHRISKMQTQSCIDKSSEKVCGAGKVKRFNIGVMEHKSQLDWNPIALLVEIHIKGLIRMSEGRR